MLQTGYENWGGSVSTENVLVFRPQTRDELIKYVKTNAESDQSNTLRAFSASHAYSNIISDFQDDKSLVLIDCGSLNNVITHSDDSVTVESGITFEKLLYYLEPLSKTLVNTPGCLTLSIAGCVSAASHGTGFQATIAENVLNIELLTWDGTIKNVKKGSSEAAVVCGGLGTCGIILSITIKTIPIQTSVEIHHPVMNQHDAMTKYMKSIASRSSTNWDHMYWIPVVDDYYYFERVGIVGSANNKSVASHNNSTGILFGISNFFSPLGAKTVDGSRTANIISANSAFATLSKVYALSLLQLPTQNSNFRLQLPVSELASALRPHFEIQLDCELFYPVTLQQEDNPKSFTTALKFINTVCKVVLGEIDLIKSNNLENEIGDRHVFHMLEEYKLWEELHDCVDKHAFFTSPVMIRYVPATNSALMAPNYKQDMFAISIAWFGSKQNAEKYKKVMSFIIKVSIEVFGAKIHFGKFSPIPDLIEQKNVVELHQIQRHYAEEIDVCRRIITQLDPHGIFQNSFTKAWFKLESFF